MARKSKIREGLHVLSLAEQEQNDALVLQVGRIVVTQSNIENVLSLVVFKVCESSFANSIDYFYSVYGFDNRLELANFLVRKDGPPALIEDWEAIYRGIKQHRTTRNLAAHQGITYSMGEDSTLTSVLSPPWLRGSKAKGRRLSVVDLKRSADDLVRIHGLLADFSRELMNLPTS